ncbi:IgGFc-binding protein, partial [Galbibacter sp. EGI 63066]|uniref:IgGFc-binding protein n=1 Tax=Galbibacter sp. EGI 63066 TaxID=2993559 RepID=UPI002249944B
MLKKILLLFVVVLGWVASVQAQGSLEHWLSPIPDSHNTEPHIGEVNISNLNTVDATVEIFRGTDTSPIATYVVPAGTNQAHALGGRGNNDMVLVDDDRGMVLSDMGYHIVSDVPVSVDHRQAMGLGSYLDFQVSKGTNAIGQTFRAATYDIQRNFFNRADFISMMATEDNTIIEVSGFVDGLTILGVNNDTAVPAGHVETIVLNRGETYVMQTLGAVAAMNGVLVQADKGIVLTNGNSEGRYTVSTNRWDLLMDQSIPVTEIGTEHVVSKTENDAGDRVYVYAHTNNTSVFLNGEVTPSITLAAGEYVAFDATDFTDDDNMHIRTTNPAYVYQISSDSVGEIGMYLVPPFICTAPRSVLVPKVDDLDGNGLLQSFHIVTRSLGEISINGTPLQDYLTAGTLTNYGTDDINGHYIDGSTEYVSYKLSGSALTGDILVESTQDLYCALVVRPSVGVGTSGGGFYSGFTPTINLRIDDAACLPQVLDVGDDLFDGYRWF